MFVCLFVAFYTRTERRQTSDKQTNTHCSDRRATPLSQSMRSRTWATRLPASLALPGMHQSPAWWAAILDGSCWWAAGRIPHLVVPPRPELANVLGYAALANELSQRERVRAAQPAETSECVPKMIPTRHFSAALTPEVQRALVAYQRGHTTCRTLAAAIGVGKTRAAELIQQLKAKRIIGE